MLERVPKSQAAYQKGRGTTEQVLALKILIDKAITSTDYDLLVFIPHPFFLPYQPVQRIIIVFPCKQTRK